MEILMLYEYFLENQMVLNLIYNGKQLVSLF